MHPVHVNKPNNVYVCLHTVQKRIIMFCLPIYKFMYLWTIYIFPGSVCLFCCSQIDRPIRGIYKSLTDTWILELGTGPRRLISGKYINRIFGNLLCLFFFWGAENCEERTERSLQVSWDDCAFAAHVHQRCANVVFEYTVELSPETEASIKSIQYYRWSIRCFFGKIFIFLGRDPFAHWQKNLKAI